MVTTPSAGQGPVSGPKRGIWSKRSTRVATIVGVVVVLAVVILVSAALSTPQSVISARKAGKTLAAQYDQQAEAALASGDTTSATLYAKSALAVDPNDARAKAVIVKVGSTQTKTQTQTNTQPSNPSAPNTSQNATNTSIGTTTTVTGDINTMLPTKLAGFKLEAPDVSSTDVIAIADPLSSALAARLTRVQLSVHKLSSAAKAAAFVSGTDKHAYPAHGQTLTIKGQTAYFGTYGKNFAVIAFAKGPFVYETILTSITGNPSSLIDVAKTVANSYNVP